MLDIENHKPEDAKLAPRDPVGKYLPEFRVQMMVAASAVIE